MGFTLQIKHYIHLVLSPEIGLSIFQALSVSKGPARASRRAGQ